MLVNVARPSRIDVVSKFACRCDEKSRAECDATMEWALALLAADGEVVGSSRLLSGTVYRLAWEYQAEITGIHCDQWCVVNAETYDKSFRTSMQCDQVEDGIAWTLRAFYDRFGQSRATP